MKTIAKSYPVATFFVLAFLITGGAALLTRLMTEGVIPRTATIECTDAIHALEI